MDIRVVFYQPLNRGIGVLAMRTLQIAEFNDIHWSIGWTTRRPGCLFLEFQLGRFKRMLTEWNNLPDHSMFSISGDEECLCALALRAAHLHIHFRQSFGLAGFDADDLPGKLRIVSEA